MTRCRCALAALVVVLVGMWGLYHFSFPYPSAEQFEQLRSLLRSDDADDSPRRPTTLVANNKSIDVRFVIAEVLPTRSGRGILERSKINPSQFTAARVADPRQFERQLDDLRQQGFLRNLMGPVECTLDPQSVEPLSGREMHIIGLGSQEDVGKWFVSRQFHLKPTMKQDGSIEIEIAVSFLNLKGCRGMQFPVDPKNPNVEQARSKGTIPLRAGESWLLAGATHRARQHTTYRVPVLSDLPIVAPWSTWSWDSHVEKEVIVLVTPWVVNGQ